MGDFVLGNVLIEPTRRRISSGDRRVVVEPRVMDLLVALAVQPGVVTSREALLAAGWPNVHVGYHALTRAVSEARKALRSVAPNEVEIETVPSRGYAIVVRRAPEAARDPKHESVGAATWRGLAPAVLACGAIGLVMHAFGAHGSAFHLASVGLLLAGAAWRSAF